jgi:predicted dehydrogenase
MENRRNFIKKVAISSAGIAVGGAGLGFSAKSYANIMGSNEKIRVGIVGFADRSRHSLIPSFQANASQMNFEITALSDIWNRRRDEGKAFMKEKYGRDIKLARNNEELYDMKECDAVIIATSDFQHALHTIEALNAGMDIYVEKPFAETMEDNRAALKAALASNKIIQVGSQRRSAPNYHAASDYIKSGKFGDITMVEMCWNVNQPGRWRRPDLVASIKQSDTDWERYQMNRPKAAWDPRKYLEYRLFWPYSSGIPGQWMSHQIDTVNWFSGLNHPRSVVGNGGVYMWKDGRSNYDTMTAVFDYGPADDKTKGFQVLYTSRMHNGAGGTKELYFSNGGSLNLDTNKVTPDGGLQENHAKAMGMQPNLLEEMVLPTVQVVTDANTGSDTMTDLHMKNWMECVRDRKQPNANVWAGYWHSVATIMTNAAIRTGEKATFDEKKQEVMVGGKPFKY